MMLTTTEQHRTEETRSALGAPTAHEDDAEQRANEHERKVSEQQAAQFARLKDEARALYGMVDGRPGVRSPRQWAELLDRAGDEIGNGRFILRYLGAERYLDAETVAVLITLRQNLIAERERASTADIMMIDAALVAYYNIIRVQGWIGNAALIFEGELFGQRTLNEIHGPAAGDRLRDQLARLSEVILPLQDRCHRMMVRSLAQLAKIS